MSDKPDSTFGKWNRPILGFLAANSVASIIVDLKLFTESRFVYRESNIQFAIDFVKSGFAGGIVGLIFSNPLTIVPAILMIRWSERRSRTRLSTYVSGGFFVGFGVFLLACLAGAVSPILFDPSAKISLVRSFQIALQSWPTAALLVVTGAISGWIYWLIAGRYAGLSRDKDESKD